MARQRTQRRQLEREEKKLAEARIKLQALEPGFREGHPIVVDASSQIEPHVRGMVCPVCDVAYRVLEHVATKNHRVVRAECPQCGRTPTITFALRSTLAS